MDKRDMPDAVPYIVHEGAMARNERLVKRLIICLAISIIMIVVTNVVWIYAWTMYDYSSDQVTVDSKDGGNANFIGENGTINNGESIGEKQKTNVKESFEVEGN